MIFNIDKETLPREDIEALQLRRLQDLCSRVYANAKPGIIMDAFSMAGESNLVFIINELDKAAPEKETETRRMFC